MQQKIRSHARIMKNITFDTPSKIKYSVIESHLFGFNNLHRGRSMEDTCRKDITVLSHNTKKNKQGLKSLDSLI